MTIATADPQPGSGFGMTGAEVAALFGVKPWVVRQWANARKLSSQRTLGGHRRYCETEVRALLAEHRTDLLEQHLPPAAELASALGDDGSQTVPADTAGAVA